jgi:hypothetical protein
MFFSFFDSGFYAIRNAFVAPVDSRRCLEEEQERCQGDTGSSTTAQVQ